MLDQRHLEALEASQIVRRGTGYLDYRNEMWVLLEAVV
jgi:hypothetical protein